MDTKKPTVLVVEDDEQDRFLIVRRLRLWAYVLEAENSADAQKIYEDNPDIDIILMDFDLGFGSLNGLVLTMWFREQGFKGPIVAMSSSSESSKSMVEAGANFISSKGSVDEDAIQILETRKKNDL